MEEHFGAEGLKRHWVLIVCWQISVQAQPWGRGELVTLGRALKSQEASSASCYEPELRISRPQGRVVLIKTKCIHTYTHPITGEDLAQ